MKRILILFFTVLFVLTGSYADFYPKDPNIDVLSYVFKVKLSDDTDDIVCQAVIEVNFLRECLFPGFPKTERN